LKNAAIIIFLWLCGCKDGNNQVLNEILKESTNAIVMMSDDLMKQSWNLSAAHRNKALIIDNRVKHISYKIDQTKSAENNFRDDVKAYIGLIGEEIAHTGKSMEKFFYPLTILDSMNNDQSIDHLVINNYINFFNYLVKKYLYSQTDLACPGPFAFSEPNVYVIPQLQDDNPKDSLTIHIFMGIKNKSTLIPQVTIASCNCPYLTKKGIARCAFPVEALAGKDSLYGNLYITRLKCINQSYKCIRNYSFCCKVNN